MSRIIHIPNLQAQRGYGLLYNGHAVVDPRNIANTGWHVTTKAEWVALMETIDPIPFYMIYDCSNSFNEQGITHWSRNYGNNSTGISLVGAGMRDSQGGDTWDYYGFYQTGYYWTSTIESSYLIGIYSQNQPSGQQMYWQSDYSERGRAVRLIKDSTSLSEGQHGTYTGNDGKVYDSVCYAGKEILTVNLKEIRYRNGDFIPIVNDIVAWRALTTGAFCYPNGNPVNM